MEIERIENIPPPPEINEMEKVPENIKTPEQPVEEVEDPERVVDLFA
ncbi:MAG: hypothetical protein JXJ04_05990 [Spirochaetales bacterium]|nr:hypothetical protein [Spirochaetales bacterium]